MLGFTLELVGGLTHGFSQAGLMSPRTCSQFFSSSQNSSIIIYCDSSFWLHNILNTLTASAHDMKW